MLFEALASGGGSDWYYTILMKAPLGSDITIDDGNEEVTAVGAGDTIIGIPVHNPSSTYNISVVASGFSKTSSATTPATSGGISSLIEVQFGEIDLIFDDEFRGLSATIANEAGTKTAIVTLPSTGNTDTLFVPDLGKWIISSTVSGDTFTAEATIGSYSVPETAELAVIPNGKTVLPVNSIEKWLLCGNIKNKSYTTLAEVLADEDTLRKLLTDDNAIDYLKRSTDWIKHIEVPTMTSNTLPKGVAKARSEAVGGGTTYYAYRAFDGDDSTEWSAEWDGGAGATNQWVSYDFTEPVIVNKFFILPNLAGSTAANGCRVKNYRIEASNDDFADPNNTVVLYTGLYQASNANGDTIEINNTNAYRYYRCFVVDALPADQVIGIQTLQFYTPDCITDSELAMSYIGAYDYAADELLDDSTWRDAIFASEYWEKIASGLIPVMTDNTHPSGEASASGFYSTDYPYKAFDGIWHTDRDYWYNDASSGPIWLQYEFPKKVNIKNIIANISTAGAGHTTATFNLEYYDDVNDTWVPIKSFVNVKTNTGAPNYDVYNAVCDVTSNKFRYYMPTQDYIVVLEMQVYDHVAGGVQNLLKLAGIDKPYTTIDELLADHDALQHVISSHDAIDYLVETKAFIEEITSDATAMRYIGKRNYAANALLGDINPGLVPIMTDDTHPSGEVTYSSSYSSGGSVYPGWKAFSPSEAFGWVCEQGASLPQWIDYEFDTPTRARGLVITQLDMNGNTRTFDLVAYDSDASNPTILKTDIVVGDSLNVEFDNDTAFSHYRLIYKSTTASSVSAGNGIKLQFYAKPADEPVWMEAIRDSEYFESVLNLTVPVLTGPNANATASTENARLGAYAWNAFDGDPSDGGWLSADNTSNGWVQYKFPSAVKILCAKGFQRSQTPWSTYANYGYEVTIQGLKTDGGTPVDLKKVSTAVLAQCSTECKINIDIPDDYLAYRMYITRNSSGADYVVLAGLQFYGRTDVDETKIDVYSAANDSFYEKDSSGNIQIIDATDVNGYAEVSKTDLPNGIHTLYSSVAKNPNDLEASTPSDYFKTVKVDDSTIEIMLMPDDALYWYGYKDGNLEDLSSANGWSRSSYTLRGVTYNTQNFENTPISGNYISGVGSKNEINANSINVIAQGLTPDSGEYGDVRYTLDKNLTNTTADNKVTYFTNVLKYYKGKVKTDGKFASITIWSQAKSRVHGWWYDKSGKQPTYLSAAYDTLYILDGNRQIPIATTNGEGKSFDALLEPGTYDIYSSVAKDPANLSNPYHKQVTITAATQTVKVMPDGALYWYGYIGGVETLNSANGWTNNRSNTFINPTYDSFKVTAAVTTSSFSGIGSKNKIGPGKVKALYKTIQTDGSGALDAPIILKSDTKYLITNGKTENVDFLPLPNRTETIGEFNVSDSCFISFTSQLGGNGNIIGELYAIWHE